MVTLTGKVPSDAHRTRAGSLAKIAGVTRVDNKLEIDTTIGEKLDKAVDKTEKAAGTAGSATKDAAVKTKDATVKAAEKTKDGAVYVAKKTKDGAEYVGEKTKDGAVKTKDEVTDGWLITKLKADFVNEDTLKGSSINVDSDNHVVTLKGTVTSEAGQDRAVEIAKTTKGVKRVINNLVDRSEVTRPLRRPLAAARDGQRQHDDPPGGERHRLRPQHLQADAFQEDAAHDHQEVAQRDQVRDRLDDRPACSRSGR